MFKIKICGLGNVDNAQAAADAGADAIGLNFYAKSPRCVSCAVAYQIIAALPENVKKVGVFVNAESDEVRGFWRDLKLDLVQLHGDEPPEYLADLAGVPIVRAFRPVGKLESVATYLQACARLNCMPAMTLIDAFRADAYGGTGAVADWQEAKTGRSMLKGLPMVLAGGLDAENVAQAIATVEPDGVDTASGVEDSPGRKSPAKLRAFVANARRAFDLLGHNR